MFLLSVECVCSVHHYFKPSKKPRTSLNTVIWLKIIILFAVRNDCGTPTENIIHVFTYIQ